MIKLGTSGFSYKDWVGTVYPPDLPKYRWLPFIAQQVDSIELNVSYYRIPEKRLVEGWVGRTPEDFLFSVKAHRGITHERQEPEFEQFRESLRPMVEAQKMACILAQFPYSFHPNPANLQYLHRLRQGLSDLPVVIEFRDRAWVNEETFALLQRLDFGFCCVDEPPLKGLMPPTVRAIGPLAYVRFHGRNSGQWWEHDHAWQRYDYTYSEEELREWIPRLGKLDAAAPLTLVYANNHYRGQSLDTLRKIRKLLAED